MTRFLSMLAALMAVSFVPRAIGQTTKPAGNPIISPAAQALLAQISDSYAKLKSLQLTGTVSWDADVAGQQDQHHETFTASFQSPRKFRHEMKGDVLVIGTGENLFSYMPTENKYMTAGQPSESNRSLGAGAETILHDQNPSLLLAMASDPGGKISDGATSIDRIADVALNGTNYPALKLTQDDRNVVMLVDTNTGLLRQIQIDLKKIFEKQDVPEVKKALLTINYTAIDVNAKIDATAFRFTPPAGAMLVDEKVAMGDDDVADTDDPAQALVGKPAPAIKLENLDGKETLPLVENKGSVIILDFWATWCPPCRAGMPHLNELYQSKKADGLKVFAVNLREDKPKVQEFLTAQKLELPVLLDHDGKLAEKYLVSGIPQTVVIGKDGKVLKVIVGFDESLVSELEKTVDAAMKSK